MNFDVVIVNYYSGERLNALLSLARDFFGDATIYIVNNSPDEAVASHVTAAADVVYIRNDRNVGFAAAVNQAVRQGARRSDRAHQSRHHRHQRRCATHCAGFRLG